MSGQAGIGQAPFGIAPYGIGTPAITPPLGGAALTGADGLRYGARRIDLATRRHVFDATGRSIGDSPVHQQMQMIATTDVGSCAVLAMGNRMKSILDITPNFVQRVRSTYQTAYADMVARKLITLGDISVDVTPATSTSVTKSLTRIKYMDLTTGQDGELTL